MIVFFEIVPNNIKKSRNQIAISNIKSDIPARVKSLHQSLFIAEFHADSLLWNRDLSKRSNYGHADIPRLIESILPLADTDQPDLLALKEADRFARARVKELSGIPAH